MGIATLLVIFGHSAGNGVVMPDWMESLCGLASVGVDIFLLVSGFGMWYSLNNLKAECLSGGGVETMVCKEIQESTCSVSDNYWFSIYFVNNTWYADITCIIGIVYDWLLDKSSRRMVYCNAYSRLCNNSFPLHHLPENKSCIVFLDDNCLRCNSFGVKLSDRKLARTNDNCEY